MPANKKPANGQVADSTQTDDLPFGSDADFSRALIHQMMVQAIGLAMQDAVAQQQRNQILKNAATTAVAKALLSADPAEALKVAERAFAGDDIVETLEGLYSLLERVEESHEKRGARPSRAKPRAAAKKGRPPRRKTSTSRKTTA